MFDTNVSLLNRVIDGDKDHTIAIKDPHDGQRIEIAVDREQRMLRLQKEGFEVVTKNF